MKHIALPALLALAACTAAPQPEAAPPPVEEITPEAPAAARILSQDAAHRLRSNGGMTLQWITWDRRGDVEVTVDANGVWHLSGSQSAQDGPGRVSVEGVVTEIGADYFLLDGRVAITDTPDAGRRCTAEKVRLFGVTQGRQYWRLREFGWCDDLTDYVDIYF